MDVSLTIAILALQGGLGYTAAGAWCVELVLACVLLPHEYSRQTTSMPILGINSSLKRAAPRPASTLAPMRWATWLLLLVVGCQPDPEFVSVGDLTVAVQLQSKADRDWQKVSLRRLYEVPREPGVVLYNPGPIFVGPDGSFYCRDFGDLKIKRFDEDGTFVQAYGAIGEGPGEFSTLVDAAVLRDSVLYVADYDNRRVTFFDVESGNYLKSISGMNAYRYRITRGGRAYWSGITRGDGFLHGTSRQGEEARLFGTLTEDQTSDHQMVFDGSIAPYGEHMIHVLRRYPIIIQYDSTGSVLYARGTPDLGRVSRPQLERMPTGGGLYGIRVSGRTVNGLIEVFGDELVVHSRPTDSTRAFDLYDAATGDYKSSIALPWGRDRGGTYDPTRERIWQVQDTTVVVYAVDR